MTPAGTAPFGRLDYVYAPSGDVAADAGVLVEVLGGRLAFAIEGMGARVAMVELTDGPPHLLLADHLEGERPVLVYRVASLRRAVAGLKKRGLTGTRLELPVGPAVSFDVAGRRIAIYEPARPQVLKHFLGRKDF
jgi:hypothetical protein